MMEARLETLSRNPKILRCWKSLRAALWSIIIFAVVSLLRSLKERGAFRVLCDTYVTEESGTGVVTGAILWRGRLSCMSGERSYFKGWETLFALWTRVGDLSNPLTDFVGEYVKDADKNIHETSEEHRRLVNQSSTKHNYPFVGDQTLLSSTERFPRGLFRVEQMQNLLGSCNQETYWVPEFVKEKRFANWLKDARDWAISRKSILGTPIPLWISEDGEEVVCIGSIKELEELSGVKVTDLPEKPLTISLFRHREAKEFCEE